MPQPEEKGDDESSRSVDACLKDMRSNITSLQTESTEDILGTTEIRSSFTPMMTEVTGLGSKSTAHVLKSSTGVEIKVTRVTGGATGTGHDQDERLTYGNTATGGSLGQILEINEVSYIGSNHNEVNTGPIL
ncbi:hypothetical protein Tco_0550244, partial [Tanacetum coccineum]